MLDIVNGRCTLTLLHQAEIPGDLFSWGDILMEGPLHPAPPVEQDWEGRSVWLEAHFGIPAATYLARMRESLDALRRAPEHEETVLWFENDLFCQVHLVFLLELFRLNRLPGRLSVICPEEERLGRLGPDRLQELFDGRAPVEEGLLLRAQRAWQAFTAPEPLGLTELLGDGRLPPASEPIVTAHLRRFPAVSNGLNAVERETLRALASGPASFHTLFPAVTSTAAVYPLGIGDAQFAVYLSELASGPEALIKQEGPPDDFSSWTLTLLLPHGLALLNQEAVWLEGRPFDRWLGGVHLAPGLPAWRWDEATRSVTLQGAL